MAWSIEIPELVSEAFWVDVGREIPAESVCCVIPMVREYPWVFVHIRGCPGYP